MVRALVLVALLIPVRAIAADAASKDEKKARCAKGDAEACADLGDDLYREDNYVEAQKYLSRACDKSFDAACRELGELYRRDRLPKPQQVLLQRQMKASCEKENMKGCYLFGELLRADCNISDEASVNAANQRAFVQYEKACTGKIIGACNQLADAYAYGFGMPRDPAQAKKYWSRSCELGDRGACVKIGHPVFNK